MITKKLAILLICLTAGWWGSGSTGALRAQPQAPVCFATGSETGNYIRVARLIEEHVESNSDLTIDVISTQGSFENAKLLKEGDCDVALIQSDVAFFEHFRGRPYLALASLYTEVVHIVARSELGISKLSEIAQTPRVLQVAVGAPRSGSASHALILLEEIEIRGKVITHDVNINEALGKLRDRELDVAFVTSALPRPLLLEHASQQYFTFLQIDRFISNRILKNNPFFNLTYIPYRLYGVNGTDTATLGVRTLLVGRRGMSAELAELLLESLYAVSGPNSPPEIPFLKDLLPENGLDNIPITIHPASVIYHEQNISRTRVLAGYLRSYGLPLALIAILCLSLQPRVVFFIYRFRYGRVLFLILLVWLVGSTVMHIIEGEKNSSFSTFGESTLAITYYMLGGFESKYPITIWGTIISVLILTLGVALATLFTATVVTTLWRRVTNVHLIRPKPFSFLNLKNHVVIVGWSKRCERLVAQLRSPDLKEKPEIVIVVPDASKTVIENPKNFRKVWSVQGDLGRKETFQRASLEQARRAAVLLDENREHPDLDVLTSLITIKSAARVSTVCEVSNADHVEALEAAAKRHGGDIPTVCDEIVDSSSFAEKLLAQTVVSPGVMSFYHEVLSFVRKSQEVHLLPMPFSGLDDFRVVQRRFYEKELIPLGFIGSRPGSLNLNPKNLGRDGSTKSSPGTSLEDATQLVVLADNQEVLEGGSWWERLRKRNQNGQNSSRAWEGPIARGAMESEIFSPNPAVEEIRLCIVGWNSKARRVVRHLQEEVVQRKHRFLFTVITERGSEVGEESFQDKVTFVFGDPTKQEVFRRAGLKDFRSVIIVADQEAARIDPNYADQRTIMVALAVSEVRSEVHIVAEILRAENQYYFRKLQNVELVSIQDLTEKLLAQALISPGVTEVFQRLLTPTVDTNEVYLVPVPERWRDKPWSEAYVDTVKSNLEMILVGYETGDDSGKRVMVLNPPLKAVRQDGVHRGRDYELQEADRLVVISYEEPGYSKPAVPADSAS